MKIRWNTTNAEIERGVCLEPVFIQTPCTSFHLPFYFPQALTRWSSELPRGLTGKKAAAEWKAKCHHLSPRDFKDLKKITKVMDVSGSSHQRHIC
jgi:hypothetical protein